MCSGERMSKVECNITSHGLQRNGPRQARRAWHCRRRRGGEDSRRRSTRPGTARRWLSRPDNSSRLRTGSTRQGSDRRTRPGRAWRPCSPPGSRTRANTGPGTRGSRRRRRPGTASLPPTPRGSSCRKYKGSWLSSPAGSSSRLGTARSSLGKHRSRLGMAMPLWTLPGRSPRRRKQRWTPEWSRRTPPGTEPARWSGPGNSSRLRSRCLPQASGRRCRQDTARSQRTRLGSRPRICMR
jgi:hypothetical protein